jgi:DNA-binding transcriptional LysR family regulator
MELRHLRYFLAVAEELHFSRAATRLHMAQPPLSQQIRKLEQALGVELVHRTNRRVELSEAGRAILPEVRRTFEAVQRVAEGARSAAAGESGVVNVGFVGSAANSVLPVAVARFRRRYPGVALTLRELSVSEQSAELAAEQLDCAFVRPPVDPAGMRLVRLVEEPLTCAVPAEHPVARQRRVSVGRLGSEPLVVLARTAVPAVHDAVLSAFETAGIVPMIAQGAESIQAVLALVAAGLGVSLLPASTAALGRDGVRFVPLTASPRLTLMLATREDNPSQPLMRFVEVTRKVAREQRRGSRR